MESNLAGQATPVTPNLGAQPETEQFVLKPNVEHVATVNFGRWGPCSVEDIPDELLEYILTYLDYTARCNVSLVSRRFCKLARTKRIHKGFIASFQACESLDYEQLARWEVAWGNAFERVELKFKDVGAAEGGFRFLERFLQSNVRLKQIRVHLSAAQLEDAAPLFSLLTVATSKTVEGFSLWVDVDIQGDGVEANLTLPGDFLKGFPALKSLEFHVPDPNWESDESMFSHVGAQLTMLDISTMSGSILNFAQNCANLRRLAVAIPATSDLSPLSSCTQLERVHVVFGPEVDGFVNLDWVVGSRRSLKRLVIQKAMPDDEQNPITCVLPNVDMPVLEAIVADDVVSHFVPGQYPKLRYMEVSGCFFNTAGDQVPSLDPVFAACPKLATIRLSGQWAHVANHTPDNSGGNFNVVSHTSLTKLRFRENIMIEDQSGLSPEVFPNLAKVELLDMDHFPITALAQCTTVRDLSIVRCGRPPSMGSYMPTIEEFLPPSLTRLEAVKVLSLCELWPTDHVPCPDLREIVIDNTFQLDSVDALAHCSQLTSLTITGNQRLERLWPPSGPHPLCRLTIELRHNNVSLEALSSCHALTYLSVDTSNGRTTHPPPNLLLPLRNIPLVHFEISGSVRFSNRARLDYSPSRSDAERRLMDMYGGVSNWRSWRLDLSPIPTWKLKRLRVGGVRVETVAPVAMCRELEILELREMAVGEYEPIEWWHLLPSLVRCHVNLYLLCPEPHTQDELYLLMQALHLRQSGLYE